MISYVTLGALDPAASIAFYDAVLGAIGYGRAFSDGGWTGYAAPDAPSPSVFICPTFDGQPARAGNGIMIAFGGRSRAEVDAAHFAGLAQGGTDEGAPGPRPAESTSFYGAYLRDPTGNKIAIAHFGEG